MRPIDADYMKEHIEGNDSKTIKNIMEWTDNQPTIEPRQVTGKLNDCISRQMMLDGLASIAKAKAKSDAQKSLMGRIIFFTEHLPSVQPQRMRGRWETIEGWDGDEIYRCSECGAEFVLIDGTPKENEYHFCPKCGSYNGGE